MMKKTLLALAGLALAGAVQAAPITGLFNTGVTVDNSTLAPPGALDAHYSLLDSPYGVVPTYVVGNQPASYATAPDARYVNVVSDANDDVATGTYRYVTTFDLTGFDASTANISASVSADNEVQVFLNGWDTGVTIPDFFVFHAFTLTTGFVAGLNTLEFRLVNFGGPAGLAVSGMSGSADLASAVPEPGSLALAGAGLGLVLVASRRRRST